MFERFKRKPNPEKKDSSVTNQGYRLLDHLIDSGDSIDSSRLANALESNLITEKQHSILTSRLLKRSELMVEGLASGGRMLGAQVEDLGIDPVTKLHRRNFLVEKLGDTIKRLKRQTSSESSEKRRQSVLCCAMVVAIDLDNLKEWNKIGHPEGDKALLTLANSIKRVIRDTDYAFRMNDKSDEIIVLLRFGKELDENQLIGKFEEIKKAINSEYIEIKGEKLPVTAAAGYVVLKAGESRDIDQVIKATDESQKADKQEEIKARRIEDAKKRLNQS
jgi:diguanylate cyclase (GGDEF)-like protein